VKTANKKVATRVTASAAKAAPAKKSVPAKKTTPAKKSSTGQKGRTRQKNGASEKIGPRQIGQPCEIQTQSCSAPGPEGQNGGGTCQDCEGGQTRCDGQSGCSQDLCQSGSPHTRRSFQAKSGPQGPSGCEAGSLQDDFCT